MKIAIISSGFLPVVDGVTVSQYQRLRRLSKLGHQVLLLCPDYSELESIYPNWREFQGEVLPGVRVVNLPSEPFVGVEFERNMSRQAKPQLQAELQAFSPDVIHVDEPDRLFLGLLQAPGVAYAKDHGIPCVGFYHTNFIDYIEDFVTLPSVLISLIQWASMVVMRPVFHAYDAILVASPVTQARVEQLGLRNVICDRVLGIDLTQFQPTQRQPDFFQTQYDIKRLNDSIKLTFLGRLTPDKGWWFTLRALAHWAKQPDNQTLANQITLIIAGDGELRDEIYQAIQTLGLRVCMLGRIPPKAVPALLANSDIHITASEKETLGLTVLEAFAAGIPVLAPEAGGVTTLIRAEQNGLLFRPQDIDSFGQSLTRLIRNADWRKKLGQQGQQDVADYSWDVVVNKLVNIWQQERLKVSSVKENAHTVKR